MFSRVAIVTHPAKPGAALVEKKLISFLSDNDVTVSAEHPDLVVSLGGDGSMLRAAQLAHAADVPLLGVNLGALGYLTEVEAGDEQRALERIFAGDWTTEERLMLQCAVEDDGRASYVGLNEVLIERASPHRLVRLGVTVDGEHLADFNADGVIVATPTGSTAYALSAGGPIISPRAACLVIVPVSPHRVFSRPVVLAPDEVVTVTVLGDNRAAELSLDGGMGCSLPPGARVTASRHPRTLKLVRLHGPGFVERLRVKLGLPQ